MLRPGRKNEKTFFFFDVCASSFQRPSAAARGRRSRSSDNNIGLACALFARLYLFKLSPRAPPLDLSYRLGASRCASSTPPRRETLVATTGRKTLATSSETILQWPKSASSGARSPAFEFPCSSSCRRAYSHRNLRQRKLKLEISLNALREVEKCKETSRLSSKKMMTSHLFFFTRTQKQTSH